MFFKKRIAIILLLSFLVLTSSCARRGLLTKKYEEKFYHVKPLLSESALEKNPNFLVYGDTQSDWFILHKFLMPDNWKTKWMLAFPFYEAFWLGKGIYGFVNWLRMTPDFGKKTRIMMRDVMFDRAQNFRASFILNTGDIIGSNGRRPAQWKIFLKENKQEHPLLTKVPYIPTVGNHERYHDEEYGKPNFEAVFDYPPFYVLKFPDAAIFVVDSNILIDFRDDMEASEQEAFFKEWFISDDPAQPAWLERELRESNQAYKIVSMHHSPLSFGFHWQDWYTEKVGPDILNKRQRLLKLFQETGVQVVFSGHDHIYQHTILHPAEGANPKLDDIHFIVSSGGGVTIRNPLPEIKQAEVAKRYRSEGYNIEQVKYAGLYHFVLVKVEHFELTVQAFEVSKAGYHPSRIMDEILIKRKIPKVKPGFH